MIATEDQIQQLVSYVSGFYSERLDYLPAGQARLGTEEIDSAARLVAQRYDLSEACNPLGRQRLPVRFDIGSHERELVRDIILARRGVAPEDLEFGAIVQRMLSET